MPRYLCMYGWMDGCVCSVCTVLYSTLLYSTSTYISRVESTCTYREFTVIVMGWIHGTHVLYVCIVLYCIVLYCIVLYACK